MWTADRSCFGTTASADREFFARETGPPSHLGWILTERSPKNMKWAVRPREKNGRRVRQKIRDATRAPARRGDTPRRRVRGHSQRRGVSTDEGERIGSRTAEKLRDASRRKSLAPRRRDIRVSGTRHRGERLCGKADEDVRAGSAPAPPGRLPGVFLVVLRRDASAPGARRQGPTGGADAQARVPSEAPDGTRWEREKRATFIRLRKREFGTDAVCGASAARRRRALGAAPRRARRGGGGVGPFQT